MSNRRRGGIVIGGGTLLALCILLLVIGIVIGLVLSGVFRTAEAPVTGGPDEVAESALDVRDKVSPKTERTDESESPVEETPPEPDVTESDDPVDEAHEKVMEYVAAMSLREKICQMMIVTPDAITGVSGTTSAGPITKAALEKYPVGGLIHFSSNITSGDQITLFNANVQSFSKTPMFIAVDEEGGRVGRLKTQLGAHSVGAMLSYEDDGEDGAYDNARTLAGALKKYGFNTDFAPVADVWSNPANTAIGDRAYSTDFNAAAALVSAAVRGFGESGVVCSLKHFPGHGDTREDSHNGAAYVKKTLDELRSGEFKPFAAGIAAGADMVMVGHLIVPEADELPATLSKTLITDILRGELGFEGVVITDSLAMGAISSKYSAEYVAVTAVTAGVDILLMPGGVEKTIAALTAAVEDGKIPESRIDESVARIIALKAARGIIEL